MIAFFQCFLFARLYRPARYRSAFILYIAIVLIGSLPGARAEAGEFASGVVLHALAYSTIAYLLFTGAREPSFAKALQAWLWVAAMGAADEFIQSFFPYRDGKAQDWIVDVVAALAMLVALLRAWPAFQKTAYFQAIDSR